MVSTTLCRGWSNASLSSLTMFQKEKYLKIHFAVTVYCSSWWKSYPFSRCLPLSVESLDFVSAHCKVDADWFQGYRHWHDSMNKLLPGSWGIGKGESSLWTYVWCCSLWSWKESVFGHLLPTNWCISLVFAETFKTGVCFNRLDVTDIGSTFKMWYFIIL